MNLQFSNETVIIIIIIAIIYHLYYYNKRTGHLLLPDTSTLMKYTDILIRTF
jgi:hypothetical protein